ncbi:MULTISPECIES: SRPBCC family protein [unclassified Agrococcus]|uniref:SRPBCC family protein n=1 Tax=unclassified Agrococcus TaxID=2615065 RepID=UPI003611AF17
MPTDLRFRSVWQLVAEPDAVQAALGDVAAYPTWWPGIARVERDDAGDVVLAVRGPLPVAVRIRVTGLDATDGVLAARLRRDVLGWCSWHVAAAPQGGTSVVMQQHVMLQRRALRTLARVAPRRLQASHAALMRAGETGLRALLEP